MEVNIINSVIAIDDVEYLITEVAAEDFKRNEPTIILQRLVDRNYYSFPHAKVKAAIDRGILDYLG